MKILVVDDDTVMVTILDELLKPKHDVHSTINVWDAVKMMAEHKFDVLITDLRMPDMNGATLSDIIRTDYPETKTIMITGSDIESLHPNIDHIDYFIRKPMPWAKLNNVLAEIQERKDHGDASTV